MQRAPSTPKTRKGRERREQISNAAMEAFAVHGSRGVSLASLAPAVGISEQGVMRYFPTKVHLLLGILERGEEQDTELFNALSAEGLTVLEILSEFARLNRERLTLQSVLMAESVDPDHPAHAWFASRNERVRRGLGLALAAAQRDGTMRPDVDPDTIAAQLLSMSVGLVLDDALAGGRFDVTAIFDAFLRTLSPDGKLRSLEQVRSDRTRAA